MLEPACRGARVDLAAVIGKRTCRPAARAGPVGVTLTPSEDERGGGALRERERGGRPSRSTAADAAGRAAAARPAATQGDASLHWDLLLWDLCSAAGYGDGAAPGWRAGASWRNRARGGARIGIHGRLAAPVAPAPRTPVRPRMTCRADRTPRRRTAPPRPRHPRAPAREYGRTVLGFLAARSATGRRRRTSSSRCSSRRGSAAPDYDAGRGSPLTWLMTIARSRAIDQLRRRVPEPRDPRARSR